MRFREIIGRGVYGPGMKPLAGSNISKTAAVNARLQRKKNIQPGTDRWFQLWFSRPYLTGEPRTSK